MKEKDFTKWTRKEFESLPYPTSYTNEDIGVVDSLVIIPTRHIHDSGYRCMRFATIQNGKPTYLISGCSDVIHLGGIGGHNHCYGQSMDEYSERVKTQKIPLCAWSIDCLPTSGLLRLFCDKKIRIGASLSSFEIFFVED
jgi:hypothetical protein